MAPGLSRLQRDQPAARRRQRSGGGGHGSRRERLLGARRGPHARALVEDARARSRALIGADPEANLFHERRNRGERRRCRPNWNSRARLRCDVLLLSGVEHPAVRVGGRFSRSRSNTSGHAERRDHAAALEEALAKHKSAGRRAFVSVMAANNETGVLQPLAAVAEIVHAAGGLLHTDAMQVAGKIPFDLRESGADLVSITSHKLGGPQGVGGGERAHRDTRMPPCCAAAGRSAAAGRAPRTLPRSPGSAPPRPKRGTR
ncbi:MAG: aminotransferase class V-fold PLP-dependent enzyme [Rhizobiales bacterium]|nr:aminotransferase class V-fold PLP-dependent enzyme [Hyphomicrobiales bacterium]